MALRYKWKYLHAKQSLSEILTGSLCNCLLEIETLNQQFQKYNQTNELIIKNKIKNYEFNSKPFNTNTFAYQNPNSESIKKQKKTSGLSGLVGLALRPLRETMQACDGAMKSLRSPIRSVAENFSDISFTFFPRFANSIRDFQSSSSSVLVCLSF